MTRRVAVRGLIVAVALASAAVVACGSRSALSAAETTRTMTDADAHALAHRVLDVLERDDVDAWAELFSARMQRRRDPAETRRMFAQWKQGLVPYARTLRDAEWTLARYGAETYMQFRALGKQPERLVRVVAERGALRIDEN